MARHRSQQIKNSRQKLMVRKQKRVLFGFLFLASGILLLAFAVSCSTKKIIESASGTHGGMLTITQTADPKSFNSILAKETSTSDVLAFIFEGLTKQNGITTDVEPN